MSGQGEIVASGPRCVAHVSALLGEGPVWDPRDSRLYWVDIKGGTVFRYDPDTGENESFSVPGMVSALGLAKSGGFICAMRDGFGRLTFKGGEAELDKINDPEANIPGNRFNDGKVDPSGGFWSGTMDDAEVDTTGSWWRMAPDGGVVQLDSGYKVTNGPAFDPQRNLVYLTDSARQRVFVAESNGETFSHRRTFLQFGDGDGYPDGMDVDRDGYLWIAFWDGAVIRRFSPEGSKVLEVGVPAPRPTSLAIVEDKIYVTSASVGFDEKRLRQFPQSGGLFEIALLRPLGRERPFYFDDGQFTRG